MTDDMSSKNSNNSDIEVINPEDLEESPPPSDVKEKVEVEVEDLKSDVSVEVQEQKTEEEVVTSVGDAAPPAPASVETIGNVEDVAAAPPPATNDDDDDPPIEVMPQPPPPAPAPVEPELDLQPAAVVRPVVTSSRPAATLEEVEDDDEEDDDDIDETLVERLVGLTEMFPDFMRKGAMSMVKNSWSLTKWSYSMSRSVTWIVFSSAGMLFMPVMIETERLQIQDQQKAQKNQMLFGTGGTGGGAPSIGPPPI